MNAKRESHLKKTFCRDTILRNGKEIGGAGRANVVGPNAPFGAPREPNVINKIGTFAVTK